MTDFRASQAIVDGVDVDAVYATVEACPGVAGLGSASPGALATYLPGRRVTGVRVTPEAIELEVRTQWDSSALHVVAHIRAGLKGLVAERRVDVALVDIELPSQNPGPPPRQIAQAERLTLPRPESESR